MWVDHDITPEHSPLTKRSDFRNTEGLAYFSPFDVAPLWLEQFGANTDSKTRPSTTKKFGFKPPKNFYFVSHKPSKSRNAARSRRVGKMCWWMCWFLFAIFQEVRHVSRKPNQREKSA